MTNTLAEITTWHQRARPDPTHASFNVQLGVHLEEVAEMFDCVTGSDEAADTRLSAAYEALVVLANELKVGEIHVAVAKDMRKDFLDALADQIVTAVGVGHCARMDVTEACKVVNFSNWSKFDHNGQPIFNENGKVTKGAGYTPPDLSGLY